MFRASALFALVLMAATPAAAQEGYSAFDIQDALSRAGYYTGPINGSMGPLTRRAISNFQADAGLPVTGLPTNSLMRELRDRGYLVADRGRGIGRNDALVSDVQAALRNRGFDLRVSGALDTETRSAIRTFQRQQGLPATGRPTAELLALLEQGRGASESQLVRQIERRLAEKGYSVGTADGVFDSRTQQAIRIYQQQRGFAVTGAPSRELLADLRNSNVTARSAYVPRTPEEAAGAVLEELGQRLQSR